jgi:hypothetical protein
MVLKKMIDKKHSKLSDTEKELAYEMACNLNVIPKGISPKEKR